MNNFTPITSSNLEAAAYDFDNEVLVVKFRNGTKYKYRGFPSTLYEAFEDTFAGTNGKSAGKFFNQNIRHLPNEKIEE